MKSKITAFFLVLIFCTISVFAHSFENSRITPNGQYMLGMTQNQVLDIMGQPYKKVQKSIDGHQYEVLFFPRGSAVYQTRYVNKNFTPLVFLNDRLQGWGWSYYNRLFKIEDGRYRAMEHTQCWLNNMPKSFEQTESPESKSINEGQNKKVEDALQKFVKEESHQPAVSANKTQEISGAQTQTVQAETPKQTNTVAIAAPQPQAPAVQPQVQEVKQIVQPQAQTVQSEAPKQANVVPVAAPQPQAPVAQPQVQEVKQTLQPKPQNLSDSDLKIMKSETKKETVSQLSSESKTMIIDKPATIIIQTQSKDSKQPTSKIEIKISNSSDLKTETNDAKIIQQVKLDEKSQGQLPVDNSVQVIKLDEAKSGIEIRITIYN